MKKLMMIGLSLLLVGCSGINETVNDMNSWEKEKQYCSNGKLIWVLERGNGERINITSQLVGECEQHEE